MAGLQQAIVALLALAVAGLLAGRIEPFIGALLLLVAAAPIVAAPARRQLLATGDGVSRTLAVLGAVAGIPAVAYATAMVHRARAAGPSCVLGRCAEGDRFAETAALAVAVVLPAFAASVESELRARRSLACVVAGRSAARSGHPVHRAGHLPVAPAFLRRSDGRRALNSSSDREHAKWSLHWQPSGLIPMANHSAGWFHPRGD